MVKAISREDEARFPAFRAADDAYRYFKKAYGKDFAFQKTESTGDGDRYWLCHLIIDRDAYLQGMRELSGLGKQASDGRKLLQSYQVIELMESGSVHIVH